MEEKIIYEYCLLRYVADLEREEFINVGLMMMSKRYRWIKTKIKLDSSRIDGFFKRSDIGTLKNQLRLFEKQDVPSAELPVEERYRWLAAMKSACIQTSPSHPGVITKISGKTRQEILGLLESKFSELFARLVD